MALLLGVMSALPMPGGGGEWYIGYLLDSVEFIP